MANAFLGVPQSYTLSSAPAGQYPASNMLNDETGLIYRSNANVASVTFDVVLDAGNDPIGAILLLGGNQSSFAIRYQAATSLANFNAGTFAYNQLVNGSMSANKTSAEAKYLRVLSSAVTHRYWKITVFYNTNQSSTGLIEFWRMLFLKKIQPSDNIEVGASVGIDDRSQRRYARGGRRNMDPAGIYPTFQGTWPWLDVNTFREDFRPLMYRRGGTYPVAFVFDHEEIVWGEDEIFYGDLEKQQSLTYEDGYLFSFGFAIVSLAP